MEKRKDTRARNFYTVVYPESAPDGWLTILDEEHIPAFISPLHSDDINPDGTPKKAHYHVMIMFDGKKTLEQAKEIFDKIGGVGCDRVINTRGYARYLCHLDNPEKAQYKVEDTISLCGADYTGVIGLALDKYKAVGEMIDYCRENNIRSYAKLLEYAREERFDWFRILCDSATVVMKEYLKSRTWEQSKDE